MSDIQELYRNAELALASYAALATNSATSDSANLAVLKDAGFSAKQAEEFAKKYPVVVAQFNDTPSEGGLGTSFSATVFKDASGNITLAIRGTLEFGDLVPTDATTATSGAAYDQIVAMWNWWQRASNPAGTMVTQYRLVSTPADPSQAVWVAGAGLWLERQASVAANGALVGALAADGDHKLDVTGHSLSGHLAMAFGALFPDATKNVTVFNAPGFKTTSDNQIFFGALGGAAPSGEATVNVIADEASVGDVGWNAIAGLHNRPGAPVDISIENQWRSDEPNPTSGPWNHSQQMLTDALAVYAVLAKLDPALAPAAFKSLMASAADGTSASLERIVDVLENTFGINTTRLASGNANRDALYQALYGLQANVAYQALSGSAALRVLAYADRDTLASKAKSDFGDFLALRFLAPVALEGVWGVLGAVHPGLYSRWQADQALSAPERAAGKAAYSDDYLTDRAAMLAWLLKRNVADDTRVLMEGPDTVFRDIETHTEIRLGSGPLAALTGDASRRHILFGTDGADATTLNGGDRNDRIYGLGGADKLNGGDGNDYLEGGAGADTLAGGEGQDVLLGGADDDRLEGGAGVDQYRYFLGGGLDTIDDADGLGSIRVVDRSGARFTLRRGVKSSETENLWQDAARPDITYHWDNGGTRDAGPLHIRFAGEAGGIDIEHWNWARIDASYAGGYYFALHDKDKYQDEQGGHVPPHQKKLQGAVLKLYPYHQNTVRLSGLFRRWAADLLCSS